MSRYNDFTFTKLILLTLTVIVQQKRINSSRHFVVDTKFWRLATNIGRYLVLNLIHVTLPTLIVF